MPALPYHTCCGHGSLVLAFEILRLILGWVIQVPNADVSV